MTGNLVVARKLAMTRKLARCIAPINSYYISRNIDFFKKIIAPIKHHPIADIVSPLCMNELC